MFNWLIAIGNSDDYTEVRNWTIESTRKEVKEQFG